MIEAHGLSKRYGDKLAVDDLSFTVRPGVVTGFLGPNGAGKSTTMRLILGLDTPSAGSVTLNGKPFAEHDGSAARGGCAARGPGRSTPDGPPATTCARWPRPRASAAAGSTRSSRWSDSADVADRRAGTFSLGMGQRLGVASALLGRPADADPRRAGQRVGPGRRPLDPSPAAPAGRRGPHGVPVLAPDERDGADRRPRHHRRQGQAPARHAHAGVHRRVLVPGRPGPVAAGGSARPADRRAPGSRSGIRRSASSRSKAFPATTSAWPRPAPG